MEIRHQRGFTLIEFVVITSILMILTTTVFSEAMKAQNAVKEAEVKRNVHFIRIALERYATDNNGCYPSYILGGDAQGWDPETGCRALIAPESDDLKPPRDPLIELGYIREYPRNRFLSPGEGMTSTISWTGASIELGDGDVRFGWDGEIMGNCLDDPRFLFTDYGEPTRLQYTMLPIPEANLGVLDENSPNSNYAMGGIPKWDYNVHISSVPEGETIRAFWPCQFFYRSGGSFFIANQRNVSGEYYENIWGWPYMRINRYIIGGYGSPLTEGLDVIRLTSKDGYTASILPGAINGAIDGEYYQDHQKPEREASHPDFSVQVTYSNPEIFGGGERGLMPQFPYYESGTSKWLFGAPDGHRDGVILVLTSEFPEPFAEF